MAPDFDDDNEDLSTLDRGDTLEPQEVKDPETPAENATDEPEAPTDEPSTEDTPDEAGEGQPRDAQGRFTRAEEPPTSEDTDDGPDDENLPIRLNKAKAQRDAERARADALEQRLKELESKAAPTEAAPDPVATLSEEVDALYVQVEEARLDGDTQAAAKLQRQIDAKNRELVKLEAVQAAQSASAMDRNAAQYNAMLDTLEARIPSMDPRSDDYDPALVQEMEFQVRAYEAAGLSPPAALARASALIFRRDVFSDAPAPAASKPTEKPAPKKPDIEKALDTQRRQPPDLSTAGTNADSQRIDVSRMTDEEFDALPEATKKRLRGDEL